MARRRPAHPAPCATCGHDALHGEVSGCVSPNTDPDQSGKWCVCTTYVNPRDRQADRAEGVRRGHDGAEAAASGHAMTYDSTDWRPRAAARLDELIRRGTDFTAEDVTDVVGVAPSPSAIGSLFLGRKRDMVQVGYVNASRPEAHGRPLRVWKGKP